MTAIRLVIDNPPPTREQLIDEAVRAAAHATMPWGVENLGMTQVLQRTLWTKRGLRRFICDVQFAFRSLTEAENEIASTPRGLA